MGSRLTFSQSDILRSKIVTPGWYPFVVKNYNEDSASTDGSALYVYELVITEGEFKNVPLRQQISEKAPGFGVEFLEVCGVNIQPGVAVDMAAPVGKSGEVFVQTGEYKGRPNNQVTAFRPKKS